MIAALLSLLSLSLALAPQDPSSAPNQPEVVGTSHFVQREGLRIHLWQKCLAGGEAAAAKAGKVALLVHGATWSGRPDFDLQIRDYSLMDRLAREGFDVWAIDIHGYGASDKTTKDWSDTASAVLDVDAAIEHVTKLRTVAKVHLLGWSWGTLIAGGYAMQRPERVARLILFGPVWRGNARGAKPPTTPYRTNTEQAARSDFLPGTFEPDVADAFARAALAADPRSPNGVIVDVLTKLPLLDPTKITCPTLVLRPDRDFASTADEMLEFFAKLGTTDKAYVSLPDAGHAVIFEKSYRRFQDVVVTFFSRS